MHLCKLWYLLRNDSFSGIIYWLLFIRRDLRVILVMSLSHIVQKHQDLSIQQAGEQYVSCVIGFVCSELIWVNSSVSFTATVQDIEDGLVDMGVGKHSLWWLKHVFKWGLIQSWCSCYMIRTILDHWYVPLVLSAMTSFQVWLQVFTTIKCCLLPQRRGYDDDSIYASIRLW